MEITLSAELEALVKNDLADGQFQDVQDYVTQAVKQFHEQVHWQCEGLAEKVAAGVAEADRGELMDEAEVREEMRKVKAEFLSRKLTA